MANDGQIVFEVTADGKHAIADIKEITRAIQQETGKWDDAAEKSANNIDNKFSGMLKKLVAGFSAVKIGKALLDIGKDALEAASALEEVQNVVDVTFGDNAGQIEKWAKNAGTQFGLTETQAKKFTSTMGAMLKSSGMAGDEIVNISTDLAGLAADMASFYNLDFEEAFSKIRSGISGQTMPLKELGIDMSVATLNAFALEQGLTKTFDKMSQSEQTMLRYQYLMQATADAQGDFSRTSDGYANSLRQMQTNIDGIKTKLGELLIGPAAEATKWINDFLGSITSEPESTVLDDFADIDIDTEGKLADLEATYQKAQDIINLIKEIESDTVELADGSKVTFGELFAEIGNVEKNGGNIEDYLAGLGVDVDSVITKYNEWKEATRQLTSTVPGLTSAIDSETGAINGGTDALQKNLDEWRAYQEKKIAWAAYYAKEQALAEKKGQMYLYEFDAGAARQAAEKARKALTNIYGTVFDEQGRILDRFGADQRNKYESGGYDVSKVEADFEHYRLLLEKELDTTEELQRQTVDYSDAERELANGKQALIEKYGEEEKAAWKAEDATDAWLGKVGKSKDEIKELVDNAREALTALDDYVKSVRENVASSIDSVVTGFSQIKHPVSDLEEQRSKLIEEQQALDSSAKDYQQKWDAIEEKIDNVNKQIEQFEPKGMKDALTSQMAFMNEYIANLEKARKLGLSNELLASLSDGSVQSAEYLMQLVSDPESAKEIDKLYQQVQEKKQEFTDELTQQQLTVDQVYQSLVDDAKKAVAELDLEGEAATNSGNTISGIAQGIADHVGEVQTAVDEIKAVLDQLNGWGINVDFGPFGSINIDVSSAIHPHETGLDYVPFNGYLAQLHEGESVLTAEEARIWRNFKDGGTDYDALGGVMRDNIKAGGNVYLDGRVVGSVISDQQGKAYRQLQRSGWQS